MSNNKTTTATLAKPTEKNIAQLKMLNSVVLPVPYGPKFYDYVLNDSTFSSSLAWFNDVLAGGVTCRRLKDKEGKFYLYIMTIGVLSAYRGLGIGTQLLNYTEQVAKADPEVSYVELHVQVGNKDALNFYSKNGYKEVELVENYYKKVTPAEAHRLTKEIQH